MCAFLQSTAADERVLITAASIWSGGEFVFARSAAGGECEAAVGSLLSEWMEPPQKKHIRNEIPAPLSSLDPPGARAKDTMLS